MNEEVEVEIVTANPSASVSSINKKPTPETFVMDKAEAEKLERIAFILKTVAHPIRLSIVRLLEIYDRLSVSEICEKLETEQSLTSHHLQNMKLKGILRVKREGRSMMYSLKERDVALIIDCLENCSCNM